MGQSSRRQVFMWYPLSSFLANHFTDLLQMSGEWYTILLASDVKERIEENSVMRGFLEKIEALDNSSLIFKFHVK